MLTRLRSVLIFTQAQFCTIFELLNLMPVNVKFFASLRQTLDLDSVTLNYQPGDDVQAIWNRATEGAGKPANTLCAINLEYVKPDAAVNDGDEVAFFPPVTGG